MTKQIEIDGSKWRHAGDAVNSLLAALGEIGGHGSSIDAFIDSMIYGDMLHTVPPYAVVVRNVKSLDAAQFITDLGKALVEARRWRQEHYGDDVEVSVALIN